MRSRQNQLVDWILILETSFQLKYLLLTQSIFQGFDFMEKALGFIQLVCETLQQRKSNHMQIFRISN